MKWLWNQFNSGRSLVLIVVCWETVVNLLHCKTIKTVSTLRVYEIIFYCHHFKKLTYTFPRKYVMCVRTDNMWTTDNSGSFLYYWSSIGIRPGRLPICPRRLSQGLIYTGWGNLGAGKCTVILGCCLELKTGTCMLVVIPTCLPSPT